MPNLTKQHDLQEHANSLADYLPNGPLFVGKKTSNSKLRSLIEGMSQLLVDAEEKINLAASEYDIRTTTLLIEEWEAFVGIPDECFIVADTLEQRRANVLTKLASLGAQSETDFIDIAAAFGIIVTVAPGSFVGTFPMTFPIMFFGSAKEARFTMIVNFTVASANRFPLTFSIPFGDDKIALLECLFSHLKPANVQLIFRQV